MDDSMTEFNAFVSLCSYCSDEVFPGRSNEMTFFTVVTAIVSLVSGVCGGWPARTVGKQQ